ncbi:MAG: hypothetical protein KGI27_14685 [Thaumarchaeota archaeon]|nr:hypothetical protein [Nitrososphaerota archaeon]
MIYYDRTEVKKLLIIEAVATSGALVAFRKAFTGSAVFAFQRTIFFATS